MSPDSSSGFRVPVVTSVKPSLGLRVHRKWKGGVLDRVLKLAVEGK